MLKTALVLGATGLVGKTLVEQLCADHRYQTITCLVRKPLAKDFFTADTSKIQPIVMDFERLQDYQGYFGAEHIYVCLGTTIKKAGSRINNLLPDMVAVLSVTETVPAHQFR